MRVCVCACVCVCVVFKVSSGGVSFKIMCLLLDSPTNTPPKTEPTAASKAHVTRSKGGQEQHVSLPSEGSESDASESSGSGDDTD